MKTKILGAILLCVSQFSMAWDKIGNEMYSIYGTRISQSNNQELKPFVELVYNKKTDSFGISFIDTKGNRTAVSYGIFNMRTCGVNTTGAIAGTSIIDTSYKNQIDNLFLDCKRPMFFRVWDTSNEQTTYKFENAGPLPEEK